MTLGAIRDHSPPYFLRPDLSLEPTVSDSTSLASQLALAIPSRPPACWEYRWTTAPTGIYMDARDLNSGPRDSSTEPSPSTLESF